MRTGTAMDLTKPSVGTSCYLPPEALRRPPPPEEHLNGRGGGVKVIRHGNSGMVGRGGVARSDGIRKKATVGRGGTHLLATPALDMWSVGCILYM